jgi:hypothetical protein
MREFVSEWLWVILATLGLVGYGAFQIALAIQGMGGFA